MITARHIQHRRLSGIGGILDLDRFALNVIGIGVLTERFLDQLQIVITNRFEEF